MEAGEGAEELGHGARGDPERSHPCDHPGDPGSCSQRVLEGNRAGKARTGAETEV